jgi:type VI secretion system ImpM family protein
MSSTRPLDPVYFGKLPTRGDFVRSGSSRPSVRALDDWLQRGLHHAKTRQPRAFERAFDDALACCFFFSPREVPGALIGVMQPSRDRSGRRYPFLIALDAGGRQFRARQLAHVPVQMGAFFERAHTLAQRVVNGDLQADDLLDRLDAATLSNRSDTAPVRDYKRYLRQTPLKRLWEQLWVHPDGARKHLLIKKLIDVLQPFREHLPARLSYGLQFPLGDEHPAGPYTTSFWWETCFRLLGFPDTTPTCFWPAPSEDPPSRRPAMLFFLRPPPVGAFASLFADEQDSDAVYPLDGQADPGGASPALPDSYEDLLDDDQRTLWSFLRRL